MTTLPEALHKLRTQSNKNFPLGLSKEIKGGILKKRQSHRNRADD